MIEKGVFLTGDDAELLSNVLTELKAKAFEESEISLDDAQALDALVSCFRTAKKEGQEKGGHHPYLNSLSKRLVLGTVIDRQIGADIRKSGSP
jgi:hypothetical protein